MANDKNTVPGHVLELLPNAEFRVELKDGRIIRCYLAGRMKVNKIRVIIGDAVEVVLPPQSAIGRITRRR